MTNEPDATTPGQPEHVVSPEDIQHQEFGVSRFGGYRMRDVDEFLDRLTASTQALLAENERLRHGGAPIVGTADLDDVNRQADEIIQRARDEASRIVGEATAQGATGSGGGAVAGDRAAVDAFLTQERDFLQRLAELVQAHAETVKGMARRARQATPPAPDERPVVVEESAAEVAHAERDAEDEDDAQPAASEDGETPDSIDVVESSAPRRTDEGEGDPALRELFWGDDT